jgi:hypothetical protein
VAAPFSASLLAGSWSLAQADWAAPQIDPIANKASTILAEGLNLLRQRKGVSFELLKARSHDWVFIRRRLFPRLCGPKPAGACWRSSDISCRARLGRSISRSMAVLGRRRANARRT